MEDLQSTIRLVAVDMDGTFLHHDDTYDRARFARLRTQMDAAGVRFVVASGNQYEQISSFFPYRDELSFVGDNGCRRRHADVERHSSADADVGVLAAVDLAAIGLGRGVGLVDAGYLERAVTAGDVLATTDTRRGRCHADVHTNRGGNGHAAWVLNDFTDAVWPLGRRI